MFHPQPSVPLTNNTPIGNGMRIEIVRNAVDIAKPLFEQTDALLATHAAERGHTVILNKKGGRLKGANGCDPNLPGNIRLATYSEITTLFCSNQRGIFNTNPSVAKVRADLNYLDPRLVLALPGFYNRQYIVDTINGKILTKSKAEERLEENAQDGLDIILVVQDPAYNMSTRTGNAYKFQ